MSASLDTLSKNLTADQFKNLSNKYSGEKFNLLQSKGHFPYEYIVSVDRLNEGKLPPKSAFYSKLTDSDISDKDYNHAQTVWKEFKCKTLRDYLQLYNKSDVLILADVFQRCLYDRISARSCMVLHCSWACLGRCFEVH